MGSRPLSSTIDRRRGERGQILVVFAGGLVLIMAIAALVFDVGQNLLDRRTEQNVSDAAALAGARYVQGAAYVYHGVCSAAPGGMPAVNVACDVAADSGYVDGQGGRTVRVDLPPIAPSSFSGLPGYIEVQVGTTRASFFAGILGITSQNTGALGVATNASDIPLPYSLLALSPNCAAGKITGSTGTTVSTNGTVHVDSACSTSPGAIQLSGSGVLTAPECDVVGLIIASGGAHNNCTTSPSGVLVSGDPLKDLPPPPHPTGAPLPVLPLNGGPIPGGCPGGTSAATDAVPSTCAFSAGATAGKIYRLYPGNYPGGISTSKATLYLDPGLYWIGGGGLKIQSDGKVISKLSTDNSGDAPSGGILIYNSVDPVPSTGCVGAGCYGPISINGGGGSTPTLALLPIQTTLYKNMVIFVDRTAATAVGTDIVLNGDNSNLSITGTIYAPTASLQFNGGDTDVLAAQIITYDFVVNGSGANLTIGYNPADLFHVTGVGLVQ